jgi:serine phosphatase RsbU (regulator of sigma subunit)
MPLIQPPLGPGKDPGISGRLRDVEVVTDAALSRLDDQALLTALLDRVKVVLQADTAAVLLVDPVAGQLVATAASGIEEEVRQGVRVPIGTGFAGRVAATGRPAILDRVDHTSVWNPLLIDCGVRSLLGVPLFVGGKVIGVLHVGSTSGRAFGPDDVDLLQLAADRAALAVHSMLSQDDRLAAQALHRSLTPSALPAVAGAALAARYVTGDGNVGGDWYDVFVLPGGQLGIVVGDVAGSGIQAAVIMGRMRSSLRSYALESTDPGDVLRRLDRKIQYFEGDAMATVLYAMYEPGLGELIVSSAGHLPPVLAVPGQPSAMAEIDVDVPIGVADDPPRRTSTIGIPQGGLLCCYTDGLVERRDQSLDRGIRRLAATIDEFFSTPPSDMAGLVPLAEDACTAVMRALVGSNAARDDIALLMLLREASTSASLH